MIWDHYYLVETLKTFQTECFFSVLRTHFFCCHYRKSDRVFIGLKAGGSYFGMTRASATNLA